MTTIYLDMNLYRSTYCNQLIALICLLMYFTGNKKKRVRFEDLLLYFFTKQGLNVVNKELLVILPRRNMPVCRVNTARRSVIHLYLRRTQVT